ncbi:MAG: PilX N-terminal domain-containing pilus assembly protein [Aromatoleum sp.]|jgi:Tfp pilus assembly protein PilX|uniref:pilus assembly PilX family protein n=1 Tax=Aromatoleum sp. TaxID=2307007 RepID=UPI00289497B1|nr:PilX N-terminal domain-containing pilus assembly protein [Aromatoleum sp.]MDT3669280.1 PilX N-terminal domain-containing pilus assembly protein [Aromatoleum sp.]
MNTHPPRSQQGATLVVGLIMLVLITLMVTSAFTLSTSNLKSVGNMQVREEAIAAANVAIERTISSDAIFFAPAASTVSIPPYSVTIAAPVCVASIEIKSGTSADSNPNVLIEGGPSGSGSAAGYKITYWDISAIVDDTTTGARAEVHQGIKITLPSSPDPCA